MSRLRVGGRGQVGVQEQNVEGASMDMEARVIVPFSADYGEPWPSCEWPLHSQKRSVKLRLAPQPTRARS